MRALAERAVRLAGIAASLVLAALAAGCGAHEPHARIGETAGIPGALPTGFRWSYRDTYHGWPLRPLHRQHPIRSSFLDPRGGSEGGRGGYHFGIDISVDDAHPDPGAPRGLSHRVYAVESGEASDVLAAPLHHACGARRVSIAHFDYWHVSPTVVPGQHVAAGAPIGWSCRGEWHVHLSEWTRVNGARIWVNPLHPGGKIAPYADTAPPVVSRLRFYAAPPGPRQPALDLAALDGAPPLPPRELHGLVELRAEVGDPQSYWGFVARHPRWETLFHPYRIAVSIRSHETKTTALDRVSFQSDQLPGTPYDVHYAPGTVESRTIPECIANATATSCSGRYWFRPLARFREELWDTRKLADGRYDVTVSAWDVRENRGSATIRVVVSNHAPGLQALREGDGAAAPSRVRDPYLVSPEPGPPWP